MNSGALHRYLPLRRTFDGGYKKAGLRCGLKIHVAIAGRPVSTLALTCYGLRVDE
jgi:hypothetical protein